MHLSNMGQLAAAVKESFATITIDRQAEENSVKEVTPPIQNRYVDSVEFSDRALELYMNADTGTNTNEKFDTDQGQEDDPAENQKKQQPVPTGTVLLNAFA